VNPSELAVIDGLNDEIAEELQTRAKEFLDAQTAEQDAKRIELGVADEVVALSGVTLPMAIKLGEDGNKTIEDVAGLVPDDLRGWFETKNGERVRQPGILESFNLTPEAAEALIMEARVAAGWIEAPEPAEAPELTEAEQVFGEA
jgi:N utilization substance protein A